MVPNVNGRHGQGTSPRTLSGISWYPSVPTPFSKAGTALLPHQSPGLRQEQVLERGSAARTQKSGTEKLVAFWGLRDNAQQGTCSELPCREAKGPGKSLGPSLSSPGPSPWSDPQAASDTHKARAQPGRTF